MSIEELAQEEVKEYTLKVIEELEGIGYPTVYRAVTACGMDGKLLKESMMTTIATAIALNMTPDICAMAIYLVTIEMMRERAEKLEAAENN